MKYETTTLPKRLPTFDAIRRILAALCILTLAVGAVAAVGLAYIYGVELLGGDLAVLLAGWVAGIGIAVLAPFLVVRIVTAILTAFRL
ncbi:hypothetical protein SAMN05421858_2459 [Haladaptatus litoreus]|uniref:Uncharacterized protein n=1 Tax=Haladaptatus litoreus TaxID=553468 RepID=A0A1N7BBC4_9EURY|nr:hypothetical protein [Haladaptatus litoreus]SIR48691.1 hypothetical protein SAMN05421858_2459 [Haladaptatus litoreus]